MEKFSGRVPAIHIKVKLNVKMLLKIDDKHSVEIIIIVNRILIINVIIIKCYCKK